MQIEQLQKGLTAKFKQSRLVFWYDPEQSFKDLIAELTLESVVILDMTDVSVFETKKRLELDEPEQAFLLYFPFAEPEADRDWLLDIRLYSEQFFADVSSILLNELGIPHMALRGYIRERQTFFASKQRTERLKRLITENEQEASLDRKMMAVLSKADVSTLTDILLPLMRAYAESLVSGVEQIDLMQQFDKFQLTEALWRELATEYGYESAKPSLADFILTLFCTDLWSQIETAERDWLLNNVLKTRSGQATALAFMASWRNDRRFAEDYNAIAASLSRSLEVNTQCQHYQASQLVECKTFEAIEQVIIRALTADILDTSQRLDRVQFERIISARLLSHWCVVRPEYAALYQALRHAEQLFFLRESHVDGFHYSSVKEMYQAYEKDLYVFDQSYRLFNEHVATVLSKGSDILRQLDEEVEKLYSQWYLYELGLAWDRLLDAEQCLQHWRLEGIKSQSSFYQREVAIRLQNKQTKRVFVIISDALRYEVAQELNAVVNSEKRFKATLSSQLGVLPSYTQLGMAALLPHKQLAYQGDVVHADGQSTQGLKNRGAILKAVKGIAVSSKQLMQWSNEEGREHIADAAVVYIYHDTIDAIGDKLATEEKTFEACRTTVNELKDLVARVINRLNGSRVLVTADHGFLFQQQALSAADKTVLTQKPNHTIEAKKRYIIGKQLASDAYCWHGKIQHTAQGSDETEFLMPKGSQRFHFIGGSRFVHGGAMLQEICVPVIAIETLRGDKITQHEQKPVGVVVKTQPIKMASNIDKISFLQTDPVDGKYIGRSLDIFIVDSKGNSVSSCETLNFDSTNPLMDQRTQAVRLKLIGSNFDRGDSYTLILNNSVTQTCHNKYPVTIDLAFQDDFF